MQIRGEISIQKVLDEIRSNERSVPFVLQFVRSTGKQKGSLKTVRAFYGRSTQAAIGAAAKREKAKTLHKEKGTLPITNADTNEYETPLISHFRVFNGYRVKH
jgi:hypothetical protein